MSAPIDPLPGELWKPIRGYEVYSISNFGRLRREPSPINKKPRLLNPALDRKGYPRTGLRMNNKTKNFRIHRLVAMAFLDPIESKTQINHKDGVKTNNHDWNLEFCTNEENLQHRFDVLGIKSPCGEQCHFAKLSDSDAVEIIKLNASGIRTATIARRFKVGYYTIAKIIDGTTFAHISRNLEPVKHPPRGASHHGTNLTDDKVIEIRKRFASGQSITEIANFFSEKRQNIYNIVRGKNWKHLLGFFPHI